MNSTNNKQENDMPQETTPNKGRKKIMALKGVVFIVIFVAIFAFLTALFQNKWLGTERDDRFVTTIWDEYDSIKDNTIDVFFMGTSQVYSDLDPLQIFEDCGITTFDMSSSMAGFDLMYIALTDALKSQSPKVIFLDVSAAHIERTSEAKCHFVLDQLPMTNIEKIRFAFTNDIEDLNALDVLFTFFRYHGRWEDLTTDDFTYVSGDFETVYTRGHYVSYTQVPVPVWYYDNPEAVAAKNAQTIAEGGEVEKLELSDYAKKYLKKIQDLCDEKGIELVLMKLPNPDWQKTLSDQVAAYAQENGLTFMDWSNSVDEIGLDLQTDYRDETDHMNQYGAEKMTRYMMNYILENYKDKYDLQDQRETNRAWNSRLKKYKAYLEELKLQDWSVDEDDAEKEEVNAVDAAVENADADVADNADGGAADEAAADEAAADDAAADDAAAAQ